MTDPHTLFESLAGRALLDHLIGLGVEQARPIVHEGLASPSWQVRRDCLRYLDHAIDDDSLPVVLERLDDPHLEVRKWAVHVLGCERCKDGRSLDFDVVPPLIERLATEESLRVRRGIVLALAWNCAPEERIARVLGVVLRREKDAKICRHALGGLERYRELAATGIGVKPLGGSADA